MNKKGFTLIEIIGVVTVLALILIVAVPSLTRTLKRNEQKKYNDYIDNIKMSAENYVISKLKEGQIFESGKDHTYISLGDLIDVGYVKEIITNPENDGKLSRDTKIKVSKEIDGTFKYEVQAHYLLPESYQLVEYIESTGTQYIDTGYIPNQDTGFDIVFLSNDTIASSGYGSILGSRTSGSLNELQLTTFTDTSLRAGTLRFGTSSNNAGIVVGERIHVTLKNMVYTNNKDVIITLNKEFEAPVELTVFALNQNGTVLQYGKVRLYSLKLYDGDILVRDYVPCYRKSDSEIGLFDLVNYEFYTNSGTGEFEKGADV